MFVNALENGTLAICRVVNVAWMLESNDSAGSAIAAANDRYSRAINAMGDILHVLRRAAPRRIFRISATFAKVPREKKKISE